MIHCAPVAESASSWRSFGIAIATIVWSMNVIATANTIAASTRFLFTVRPTGRRIFACRRRLWGKPAYLPPPGESARHGGCKPTRHRQPSLKPGEPLRMRVR